MPKAQCGKNGNLLSHFSDLNFVKAYVIFTIVGKEITKLLVWRDVSLARVFFSFYYICTYIQCGNCRNSLSHFFSEKFRDSNRIIQKSLKSWFDEFFFSESTVWKSTVKRDHAQKFPWNQLFISNLFSKTLSWRKNGNFPLKMAIDRVFDDFSTLWNVDAKFRQFDGKAQYSS